MLEFILFFILCIPLYGVLIWSFLCPEESVILGKRWLFNHKLEPSTLAIQYTKWSSLVGLILLTVIFILYLDYSVVWIICQ